MAELPNGITGVFIGRIGNIVGYMLNGKNIIRNIGKTGPHNDNQKANETKLGIISALAKVIDEFLAYGFKNSKRKPGLSTRSYAIGLNKKVAVKGKYPRQKIDFKRLIVSEGNVPAPKNAAVKLSGRNLEFSWQADLDADGADEGDQVMLLAYLPEGKKAIKVLSGARRTEEFQQLQLPASTKDYTIEVYISYISDDRSAASPSVYLGKHNWTKNAKANGNN